MDGNISRRFNAELDLVAVDCDHDNANIVADHNRLVDLSAQNKHGALLAIRMALWPHLVGVRSLLLDGSLAVYCVVAAVAVPVPPADSADFRGIGPEVSSMI